MAGPKIRKKLKKKPVKKKPVKKITNPTREAGFGSIFASTALPGLARVFSKLVGQGYSEREAAIMANAIKKMKDKE